MPTIENVKNALEVLEELRADLDEWVYGAEPDFRNEDGFQHFDGYFIGWTAFIEEFARRTEGVDGAPTMWGSTPLEMVSRLASLAEEAQRSARSWGRHAVSVEKAARALIRSAPCLPGCASEQYEFCDCLIGDLKKSLEQAIDSGESLP